MEIGSEFWTDSDRIVDSDDYTVDFGEQLYLSGRSALNAIILDMKQRYHIQKALLPSYCCDSIIVPFLRNDISVRFYEVYLDSEQKLSVSIPKAEADEALFLMHFFGARLHNFRVNRDLSDWAVIIEDDTHSYFSQLCFDIEPHYSFVSFRKWFAVTGIAPAKFRDGRLPIADSANVDFIKLRNEAFAEKRRYILHGSGKKEIFLKKFGKAEELLNEDCSCYMPDPKDYNRLQKAMSYKEKLITVRRENAAVLIKGLKDIEQISVIVDFDLLSDCPMFVPIIEKTGKRSELRKHLIEHEIYCPVHWPVTEYHNELPDNSRKIYDNELSLVCDQRYTPNDMARIIDCIKQFYS
jgi:hypothetical protein